MTWATRLWRRMVVAVCTAVAPQAWAFLRMLERHSGVRLQPLPAAPVPAHPSLADALFGGPGIYTMVAADGRVVDQRGGSLYDHGLGPTGWTGLKLPVQSETLKIVQAVIATQRPCEFHVGYEGIAYAGIAFPAGDYVVMVSLPPMNPLAVATSADASVAALQRMARDARAVISRGEVSRDITTRVAGA